MTREQAESADEFAVNVQGVGWVAAIHPLHMAAGVDEPTVFEQEEDAWTTASRVEQDYLRLGLPDVARRVTVVTRQVTVTRGQWAPHARQE